MTDQPVAPARGPYFSLRAWRARLLPAALERDDRVLFRDFVALGSALFAVTLVAYALTIDWRGAIPRDGTTLAVGRDFLNIWMYGRAAFSADPSQFYDLDAYHAAIRGLLGMEFNGQNWSYPPSILLLAAPFGQLNYFAALAFVAYLLMRLRASPRPSPGARGTLSFKGQAFHGLRLCPVLAGPHPPPI